MEMNDGPHLPYIFPITKSTHTAINLECIRHNVPIYNSINLRLYIKLLIILYDICCIVRENYLPRIEGRNGDENAVMSV